MQITWWNGTSELKNSWLWRTEHPNGTGEALSEITLILERAHLGKVLTCRVNSTALDTPLTRSVEIDMNLAPESLEMRPQGSSHVDEGGLLTVTCVARGAKPAASIYWNSEPAVADADEVTEVTPNGRRAFDTVNQLTFRATRKLTSLSCFASNSVVDEQKVIHLTQATTINVRYKPRIQRPGKIDAIYKVQGGSITLYCKYEANPASGTIVTWYREGRVLAFDTIGSRFSKASKDASILRVESLEPSIEGRYSCSAENVVGRSDIVDVALVKVETKPRVTLSVDPATAVSETLNANVTLMCLSERDEEKFRAVKWFLDGELLKRVVIPDECFENGEEKPHQSHNR